MNVDDKLIINFRETVNRNNNFVFETYHSRNEKNQWNIICSCMDWISVAVRFLSNKIDIHEDVDVRVMQFFSIISAIDIVFEGINQLHRVIFNDGKIPFKGKTIIFKNNKLNKDDNGYFKEIRAMFGAHPVNLKHSGNKQWFASWPYDHDNYENMTFKLRLYSNEIGVDDITFGVNISDLEVFLLQRYGYLENLKDEIINQYTLFCNKQSLEKIQLTDNPLDNIKILEKESKQRLNNEYYDIIICELIKIFSTSLNEDILLEEETEYKKKLLLVIDELHKNYQQMKFDELQSGRIIDPDYAYSEIGYSISKLFDHNFDRNKEPLFDFHLKELDKYSGNRYKFSETINPDAIFLKLKMMLYKKSEEKN